MIAASTGINMQKAGAFIASTLLAVQFEMWLFTDELINLGAQINVPINSL